MADQDILTTIVGWCQTNNKNIAIEYGPHGFEVSNKTDEGIPLNGWNWEDNLVWTTSHSLRTAWEKFCSEAGI